MADCGTTRAFSCDWTSKTRSPNVPGRRAASGLSKTASTPNFLFSGSAVRLTTRTAPAEVAAGEGADPEDGLLALADAGDVLGRDGHDELDPGIVHQRQRRRRPAAAESAHHRVDDIADLGVLRGDDPGERRPHEGDVEGVLDQVEAGPGLLELGGGRVEGQLDLLALLLGDGVLLDQPVHPFLVPESVGVARFGHGHAGLGLLELEADGLRLELGQELALGHAVAGLDIDARDLAARLRGDVDLVHGLDRAGVGDLLRDPGPLDLEDLDGRRAVRLGRSGRCPGGLLAGEAGDEDGRGERDDDQSWRWVFGCFMGSSVSSSGSRTGSGRRPFRAGPARWRNHRAPGNGWSGPGSRRPGPWRRPGSWPALRL